MDGKRDLGYAAGVLFIVLAMMPFQTLMERFSLPTFLQLAGYGMLAAAAFLAVPSLAAVGSVLNLLPLLPQVARDLREVLGWIGFGYAHRALFLDLLPSLLLCVYYLILLVSGVSRSSARGMGFAAAAVSALHLLVFALAHRIWMGSGSVSNFFLLATILRFAAAAFLGGMAWGGTSAPKAAPQGPAEGATPPIEELTKLKSLLDAGVITQSEFDGKKKQLLGV